MSALPPNDYTSGRPWHRAYERCQRLEKASEPSNADGKLMRARLLGFMVREAPTDIGRTNMSNEINDCRDDSELYVLADMYLNHFVRCFRSKKGSTPAPSFHVSRPSFDDAQIRLSYLLQEAPKNHSTAKEKALIRDGYRCVLSGKFDTMSYVRNPAALPFFHASPSAVSPTQAAHIFPDSTNQGISGENEGGSEASTVWTVMERFGQVNGEEELNGPNIHRLENVMTLNPEVHFYFDLLMLWLEATDEPNQYKIGASNPVIRQDLPQLVTFTTLDAHNLPLPSPRYLALHAACARVVNLCGAAEHIDTIVRDIETLCVLAKDGFSADVLSFALGQVAIAV
ncbi:hypothetical protein JAAARDRAFT_38731 [Jaapia argillacea MUCL 33604]|uniref:HNH nuclease domain-containing protein n=1 Tax=Jaapia argillacea MUCL 33604 TaxID=933084 RepID=A0A067PGS2_9AGAM|nr:hypothetical protein JAAARDRAFT_38731 [Jaapia argillacea MUCL 33604]